MKVVHLLGQAPLYTNSFLVVSEGGHAVVIDPVCAVSEYKAALTQYGAQLVAVFCTHGHYDHVGSAMELRDEYNVPLYCNPEDTQGNQLYPLSFADKGYVEGEVIAVDELNFTVWRTKGHTEGSVCILCGDYFFTGDMLFRGSTGRTDMPGGNNVEMRESCKKLIALDLQSDTKVLPGHDAFSTYGREMEQNWYIQNARL